MTTFISILIWIGLLIIIVLCVRNLISRIKEIREKKKSQEDKKESEKEEVKSDE